MSVTIDATKQAAIDKKRAEVDLQNSGLDLAAIVEALYSALLTKNAIKAEDLPPEIVAQIADMKTKLDKVK